MIQILDLFAHLLLRLDQRRLADSAMSGSLDDYSDRAEAHFMVRLGSSMCDVERELIFRTLAFILVSFGNSLTGLRRRRGLSLGLGIYRSGCFVQVELRAPSSLQTSCVLPKALQRRIVAKMNLEVRQIRKEATE